MKKATRKIEVEDDIAVTSEWLRPECWDQCAAIAIAHGAGNDMHSPFISHVHQAMAAAGLLSVKFNFPYKEHGGRLPDRPPRLMRTWRQVMRAVDGDPGRRPRKLILAGKSLGGRMASMVTAADNAAAGLVFFGYPLHPPGQPDKLRVDHLKHIRCPMLFIQGSRDALCDLDLLDTALKSLEAEVALHVVEAGDHSFRVPKRAARAEREVWREITEVTIGWIRKLDADAGGG